MHPFVTTRILRQILVLWFVVTQVALAAGVDNPVDRRISVHLANSSLREVVNAIAEKSGVEFVFDDQLLQAAGRVSTKSKNKTPVQILEKLLEKSDIGFVVQSASQIVLTRKSTIKRKFGALKGRVVHSISGDPLEDANLEVLATGFGTATNAGGFFEVQIPAGSWDVRASMIGFEQVVRREIAVEADKATYVTFRLLPTVIELAEVKVVSNRERVPQQMQMDPSVRAIRRAGLIDIPTVGEPDLFRALQTLPGVSSPNDFTNELYIRGGDADQNLILLDGAVVYNPYHMFGLAGAFNPDLIEQVNLSLGGFSARYGDRLSSVIDVQTRNGSPETASGYGNLSLISSKFTTINRLTPNLSFIFSGRRTYHDVAAQLFVGKRIPYYFYDMYGKMVFQPGEKDLLYFSTFFSRDKFEDKTVDQFGTEADGFSKRLNERFVWDNLNLTAHWLHEFSPGNEIELQVSQSSSPSDFSISEVNVAGPNASDETRGTVEERNATVDLRTNIETDVSLRDRTFRLDWTLGALKNQVWNLGVGYSHIRLNYFWENLLNEFDQQEIVVFFDRAPSDFNFQRRLQQYYFYVENHWQVSDRLALRPGLRLEKRDYQNAVAVEPRVNLSYQFTADLEFKAAYGRFHQGLATSAQEGILRFLPLPFPTEGDTPLEKANHFIAGMRWDRDRWKFSADAYYKSFSDILRAVNGSPGFEQSTGKAYGLEMGVKKLGDRLTFEMNYGLAFSKRKFRGHEYFNFSDQRHSFTTFGKYHLGKNWMFNFRWVLATGRPFTSDEVLFKQRVFDPLTGEWRPADSFFTPDADFSEDRNQIRYPVYHRLDVGLVKRVQKRGWAILPYVQVVNAYYRRNVLYYDWSFNGETGLFERGTVPMMPIIPTFGVSFEF